MGDLRSPCAPGPRAGRRIGDRPQVLHSLRGLPARFPNNIGVLTVVVRRPIAGRRLAGFGRLMPIGEILGGGHEESATRIRNPFGSTISSEATPRDTSEGLPNRLLTAREVARFVGCHEETVRRAYWRGLLRSQRFGVRGRRFHPDDVLDWIQSRRTDEGLVNGKEHVWLFGRSAGTWAVAQALDVTIPGTST